MSGPATGPFASTARRADPIVVLLFAALNGAVLWNARAHYPPAGYDANAHIKYAETLAEGRLPGKRDTYEYFSPPLSYLAPALALRSGLADPEAAPKLAQLLNAACSIGVALLLLRLAERLAPGNAALKRTALLLLGLLPVYYKTFAFVRPEPLLALVSLAVLDEAVALFESPAPGLRAGVRLGVLMGLALLARQQGLFVIGAVSTFALVRAGRGGASAGLRALAVALAVAFAVGGWFYVGYAREAGTVLAYSQGARPERARAFFLGAGDGKLFTDPVRPGFRNQFWPVLYSETWGDHGCYFLVYGSLQGAPVWGSYLEDAVARRRSGLRTNREAMGRYLGRVNLVSLVPTLVLLGGVAAGVLALGRWWRTPSAGEPADVRALLALTVVAVFAGYASLLALFYSNPTGSLIKATYILPLFPPAALLAAAWLETLRARRPRLHRVVAAGLLLALVHNAPAFVTRYRLDERGKMMPSWGEADARGAGEEEGSAPGTPP